MVSRLEHLGSSRQKLVPWQQRQAQQVGACDVQLLWGAVGSSQGLSLLLQQQLSHKVHAWEVTQLGCCMLEPAAGHSSLAACVTALVKVVADNSAAAE
jgi:hypothetical protein